MKEWLYQLCMLRMVYINFLIVYYEVMLLTSKFICLQGF